jgi:hypothetical protein
MNVRGIDIRQMALNAMRWLSGSLDPPKLPRSREFHVGCCPQLFCRAKTTRNAEVRRRWLAK